MSHMKTTLQLSLFLIVNATSVIKSQDTIKTSAKTIEIIAPASEIVVEEEPVFQFADENAMFEDGGLEKFRDWVQRNLVYPPITVENDIQGTVIVQFSITSQGKLVESKILRGVDPSLDNEVLRVVNSSPDWKPAMVKGKPVKEQLVMPVMFGLVSGKRR
ncbi:MAG TPA: energy transducer TonB [Bacteroidales bacterium]|nr:energy transducer TonB [Bacteroidales bacterium]